METQNREEYYQLLEQGAADICMDAGLNYSTAEDVGYKLTSSYLSTGISRITRTNLDGEVRIIASMGKSFLLRDYLEEHFTDLEIRYYDSIEECLRAVEEGEADAAFLYNFTVQDIMNRNYNNHFSSSILNDSYAAFAIGVRGDCDCRLITALNRAVKSLRDTEVESIILEKTEYLTESENLRIFLMRNPRYAMLLVGALGLFAAIAGIAVVSKIGQRRLQRVNQELNAANNAKREFLSKMSHNIRTPMNAIIGMTELADENIGDEHKVREYLKKMRSSEKYLLNLINEVLDMNKLESGTVILDKKPFSIRHMLAEIEAMARDLTDVKEQHLLVEMQEIRHEYVLGDAQRMEQMLLNLLSNAAKYTGEKGQISLLVSEESDGVFCFRVKDNGIGIPEEYKQRIFEAFSRVEDSRISRVQGSGLGLTIVKGYVDLMGGTISLESEVGQGSGFLVRLPLELCSEESLGNSENSEEAAETTSAKGDGGVEDTAGAEEKNLSGLQVLLVEDNELNREIAEDLLDSMGARVDCAENGKEGVDMFLASKNGFYDVILMDLQMPVMNGWDACREIRRADRADAGLPVLALTANAHPEDIEKCTEEGMNAHISKPIDVSVFYDLLKEICEEKKSDS